MQAKLFLKIRLLAVNFEKFTTTVNRAYEIRKAEGFLEWLALFWFIITSVKIQPKLLT